MNPQPFSIYLISIATVLNIIGAALNALSFHWAFLIWIGSNAGCYLYFDGAERGWWNVEKIADRRMKQMYGFFMITSTIGWMGFKL